MVSAALLLLYTYRYPTANLIGDTYRYVYIFDISQSMNVTDAVPGDSELTRLDYAKMASVESLSSLPSRRPRRRLNFTSRSKKRRSPR